MSNAHILKNSAKPSQSPSVFTTMRWDRRLLESPQNTAASCNSPSAVYLFEHHWTRLQVAKWGTSWYTEHEQPAEARSPARVSQIVSQAVQRWETANRASEAWRVKLICHVGGQMSVEIGPLVSLPHHRLFPAQLDASGLDFGPTFVVVLDTQATEVTELTMYKTSYRDVYMRARDEAGIESLSDAKEVLLFSTSGLVFDGSISTPYFFREGRWVTPSSQSGGQQGVTRRWAIENHLAIEGNIIADELRDGEQMWLSNAVKGFYPAVFSNAERNTTP